MVLSIAPARLEGLCDVFDALDRRAKHTPKRFAKWIFDVSLLIDVLCGACSSSPSGVEQFGKPPATKQDEAPWTASYGA